MREISVHYDDEIACDILQAVDVGGAETELAGSWFQYDVICAEGFLKFFGSFEGAVRGSIIDDYYFPVEISEALVSSCCWHLRASCWDLLCVC